MPRRTKLSKSLQNTVVDALRSGRYASTAADLAGIAESTYYAWKQRGERDIERGARTRYAEFSEAIKRAEAEAEAAALATIIKAGNGYDVTRVVVKHSPVTDSKGMPVLGPDGRPLFTETREIVTSREFVWQAAAWYLERRYPKRWGRRLDMTSGDEPLRQPVLLLDTEKFLHGTGEQPGAAADRT